VRYQTPAAFRAALEARLLSRSTESGVDLNRLRRRVVFERMLVRLEASEDGRWVLKGGMALEVRWLDRARATRDLDLSVRDDIADGNALRELLISALEQDPDGDWFLFAAGTPKPLATDEAGRPGWRFPIAARLAGRRFADVRVDVVARVDEIGGTERIALPNVLSFAALPAADVEVVDRAQHFAEKLHALTRVYSERPSTRVKDLPDLLMLIEDGLAPTPDLLRTIQHVFAVRGTHDVPVELADPPTDWSDRYAELAVNLDVQAKTIEAAMGNLRAFWARVRSTEET
jgi:hypothetical protein